MDKSFKLRHLTDYFKRAGKNKMADKNKCRVRTVLLNLINKQSMPGFNYDKTKFSFQTVFYQSTFSCCACKCGIAMETLEFINNSGNVFEHVFDSMVDNISRGKCPHVDGVPEEYISEAKLLAIRIVAAVGCIPEAEEALNKKRIGGGNSTQMSHSVNSMQNLYELALLHALQGKNHPVLKIGDSEELLTHVSKWLDLTVSHSECLEVDQSDIISLCIHNKYFSLLSNIIKRRKRNVFIDKKYGVFDLSISLILHKAFRYNSAEAVDMIVNDQELYTDTTKFAYNHCILAIVHDRPDILNKLLGKLHWLDEISDARQKSKVDSGDMHGPNAGNDDGWNGPNEDDDDWHGPNANDDDWHGPNADDDDWHGPNADDGELHGPNADDADDDWNDDSDNSWDANDSDDDDHGYDAWQGAHGLNQGAHGVNQGAQGVNQGAHGFNQAAPGFNQGVQGFNQGVQGFNQGAPGVNQGAPGFNQGAQGVNQRSAGV